MLRVDNSNVLSASSNAKRKTSRMETESSPQHLCQQQQGMPTQRAQDLHRYEERFALAMQGTNDGWWERDLRTNLVYFSPRWKQIFGYTQIEQL
jgi:PAS domain-containing protein